MSLADEYQRRCREWSDIHEHLPTLFDAVMKVPGRPVVVELGTRSGNSTSAFLYAAQVRQGGEVHSFDIDVPQVPDEWFTNPRWHFWCDSSTGQRAKTWTSLTGTEDVDVLFVDTDHTYETTMDELNLWMPRVRPGGVALFHDTQVMNDVCDVKRALDDWCTAHHRAWTEDPRCFGLGRIEV